MSRQIVEQSVETAFVPYSSEAWQQARGIRYDLFFRSHGLPVSVMDDDLERGAFHCVVRKGEEVAAYGRLHVTNQLACVSQMVVRDMYQKQGLGRRVLSALVHKAKEQGCSEVALNARVSAQAFYTRAGFAPAGSTFSSVTTGILHVPMVLSDLSTAR